MKKHLKDSIWMIAHYMYPLVLDGYIDTIRDLESLLTDDIDAFIVNPLNAFDFPKDTIDYLKSFNVPIYISFQGFLRYPHKKIGDNYSIKLKLSSYIKSLLFEKLKNTSLD